jgi:tetratricopeptide (TPR) repeat protein
LILADYNNEAITVLKEALSITQITNNSQPLLTAQIYNNLAIARYKDGLQIDVDLSKKAIDYLSQAIESYQKLPASYYNLAVLSEINHLDAHGFFQTFLQLYLSFHIIVLKSRCSCRGHAEFWKRLQI